MRPFFLGLEGGGTRTVAILADAAGQLLHRVEAGPANVKLLDDAQLSALLSLSPRHFRAPIISRSAWPERARNRICSASAMPPPKSGRPFPAGRLTT